MSRPKRLPGEDYDRAIAETEAYLHKHLPKEGDRSMTWTMARLRFLLSELFAAEAQKASLEPAMPALEFAEQFCGRLIERAKKGDKQADVDLRMLAIDFLDAAIKGGNDAAAPRALLGFVRDVLENSLPHDKERLRARQSAIATAVDQLLKLDICATRNQASRTAEHPESACSLVAKALENVGHAMGEDSVQLAWQTHCLLHSKNFSEN